ncbi:PhzF family phenazine biosynthesis protein [Couchioplanes caeruleus]|nr:PhzF family phenazine biosynthesis protein [Couchioplanes caeruleus]ROP33830.1 trans-2,3-dihydro-3-hydroxyanthranilate isomerase [Couchioplanes caeruleus]
MTVSFEIVGVFGTEAGGGSPLAVVHDADGLDTAEMQWIAGRLCADETVFVLRPTMPGATYRVRVFTAAGESPFGGHSAVGTAVSVVRCGVLPAGTVVQECAGRLLTVRADADRAALSAVGPQPLEPLPADPVLDAVGLTRADLAGEPVQAGFGPLFRLVPVRPAALARARPDFAAMGRHALPEVFLFSWDEAEDTAVARLFAPGWALPEDPACASVGLAFGAWLAACPVPAAERSFRIRQGAELGRPALLEGTVAAGGRSTVVTIGGQAPRELAGQLTAGSLVGAGHASVFRTSSVA